MFARLRVNSRRWLPACLAAVLCPALLAEVADRGAWDFTLPTLAGDRFVRASQLKGPVLVNFWGCYCPPCVEELSRLQAFADAHHEWTVLLVCTDPPQQARVFLQRHHIAVTALRSGADITYLMRAAGNTDGGLPFTVVLRDGRILQAHQGGLAEGNLAAFVATVETGASRR